MERLHALFTLFGLLFFIGVVLWAYSGRRQAPFEAAARLPLEDDTRPPLTGISTENPHGGFHQ